MGQLNYFETQQKKIRYEKYKLWAARNKEKVRGYKQKYEAKRKEARRLRKIQEENEKYF